ncbi:hypothetical protein BJ741DRAFT_305920 [Chytriomyces cf. hyalinus JEL632]|nr:hypothetical protein BJ741DRAFT_305920 [Chytriomyces cf. hyalinus JEL632]
MSTRYLERFEVVGRGSNVMPDGSIVVQAGWDIESFLEAAVVLKLGNKLKNVRIQAEFRGFMETRWESMGKEATKPESEDYKVQSYGRVFQQIVEVVHDSKEAIMPNATGGSINFPFKFNLPATSMPPSFNTVAGSIQYVIKVSMLYQEGMNLLKSSCDVEVPVTVIMPEMAKYQILAAPSQMHHRGEAQEDKVDFSVEIQKRILCIGDSLEVDVIIHSTPGDTRIRSMNASLRSVVSYIHKGTNVGSQSRVPRPLSEMSQAFPLVKVGITGAEPIARRVYLLVDPELASASFESPFISSKTIFRLEIIIDDSETPNISYEVPVVVLPSLNNGHGTPSLSPNSPSFGPKSSPPLSPHSPNMGPMYSSRKTSIAQSESGSIFDSTPFLPRSINGSLSQPYYNPIITTQNGLPPSQWNNQAPPSPPTSFRRRNHSLNQLVNNRLPRTSSAAHLSPRINPRVYSDLDRHGSVGSGTGGQQLPSPVAMQRSRSMTNTQRAFNNDGGRHFEGRPMNATQMIQMREMERLNSEQDKLSQLLGELRGMEVQTQKSAGPSSVKHHRSVASNSSLSNNVPKEYWTVQMVSEWIQQMGGDEEVVQKFIDQQIDGVVLMTLTMDDLRSELGITQVNVRRAVMEAIETHHRHHQQEQQL